MEVREHVPLSELTTLSVGGPARVVYTVESREDLATALTDIRERGVPFVVLGEGSNVLPDDAPYEGAVILMRTLGMEWKPESDATLVAVEAGVHWDDFVRACAERTLWGVENLAGIPGTVGASPVQNIGAYGMELSDTLVSVDAVDARTRETRTFRASECGFSYRDSRFKHEPWLIITRVTFRLARAGTPQVGYSDLRSAQEAGENLTTPTSIGECVRRIRSRKFPDLTLYGTAGSFFKNPILSTEQFAELAHRYGALPSFPMPDGVKVPLAYLLDHVLGLRGYRQGPTFLFGNQPLVLVADRGASAGDVDALACEIETRVRAETGIVIEREVRDLRFHECSE